MTDNKWLLRSTYSDGVSHSTFKEMLDKYVDVIVDGPFIEEQKDLSLKWRGSRNQRVWKKNENNEWYVDISC
jgi:organic radical activating enzyme